MTVRHWHVLTTVVGIVVRPDGSRSNGRYLCFECGRVLDYIAGRWTRATP